MMQRFFAFLKNFSDIMVLVHLKGQIQIESLKRISPCFLNLAGSVYKKVVMKTVITYRLRF